MLRSTILGNVLLFAMLLAAIAASILVAHAGRQPGAGGQAPEPASAARQGDHADATGWMKVPRGSLVDAAL